MVRGLYKKRLFQKEKRETPAGISRFFSERAKNAIYLLIHRGRLLAANEGGDIVFVVGKIRNAEGTSDLLRPR